MAGKKDDSNIVNIGFGGIEPDFFDSRIDLIPIAEFCRRFGYSKKTVYDWKYKIARNKIPINLIVKFRGKLFIRVDVFNQLVLANSIY